MALKLLKESFIHSHFTKLIFQILQCQQVFNPMCSSIQTEKVCKMFMNQNSAISNFHTNVGEHCAIQKNLISIFELKGHIYTNKGITFNSKYLNDMISLNFVNKIGNYSLFTIYVHIFQGNVREPGSRGSRIFSCLCLC